MELHPGRCPGAVRLIDAADSHAVADGDQGLVDGLLHVRLDERVHEVVRQHVAAGRARGAQRRLAGGGDAPPLRAERGQRRLAAAHGVDVDAAHVDAVDIEQRGQ